MVSHEVGDAALQVNGHGLKVMRIAIDIRGEGVQQLGFNLADSVKAEAEEPQAVRDGTIGTLDGVNPATGLVHGVDTVQVDVAIGEAAIVQSTGVQHLEGIVGHRIVAVPVSEEEPSSRSVVHHDLRIAVQDVMHRIDVDELRFLVFEVEQDEVAIVVLHHIQFRVAAHAEVHGTEVIGGTHHEVFDGHHSHSKFVEGHRHRLHFQFRSGRVDDDAEESENAGLATIIDVAGTEGDSTIRKWSRLEFHISVVHVGLVDGDRFRQTALDVELHHISRFSGLHAHSSEQNAQGR